MGGGVRRGPGRGRRSAQSPDCPDGSGQAPAEGEDGAGNQRVAEVGQPHQDGRQRRADDLWQSDQHEKGPGPAHHRGRPTRSPIRRAPVGRRMGLRATYGWSARSDHPDDLHDQDPQDDPVDHPQRPARRRWRVAPRRSACRRRRWRCPSSARAEELVGEFSPFSITTTPHWRSGMRTTFAWESKPLPSWEIVVVPWIWPTSQPIA